MYNHFCILNEYMYKYIYKYTYNNPMNKAHFIDDKLRHQEIKPNFIQFVRGRVRIQTQAT